MTYKWNSKNKNWHYYICLKLLPGGILYFILHPKKVLENIMVLILQNCDFGKQ
jgi:hypothetical protein